MLKFNFKIYIGSGPDFKKRFASFENSFLLFFLFCFLIANKSLAENSCPWLATANQSVEKIQKNIQAKSGKMPTVSCGAGKDFKVCHSCEDRLTDVQWKKIQQMLAQPAYRAWHNQWHVNSFMDAVKKAGSDEQKVNQLQGENFFFAHREAYRSVQANLAALGLPCISPWTELPKDADDQVWPSIGSLAIQKLKADCPATSSDIKEKIAQFEEEMAEGRREIIEKNELEIKTLEQTLKDRNQLFVQRQALWIQRAKDEGKLESQLLKKHTLTQKILEESESCDLIKEETSVDKAQESLFAATKEHQKKKFQSGPLGLMGRQIEMSWHGQIHANYDTTQPKTCHSKSIEPECDSMRSPFSSHVNIHFYKAHGLIDNYVDNWLAANNYDTASTDCGDNKRCYTWKGTYTGAMPDFVTGQGCTIASLTTPGPTGTESRAGGGIIGLPPKLPEPGSVR